MTNEIAHPCRHGNEAVLCIPCYVAEVERLHAILHNIALHGCSKCAGKPTASEPFEQLTEAEKLLQAWADPLPPNGKLYWDHVHKAREYFKGRAVKSGAESTRCSFCGETKIHGPKCGYAGSPVAP